jgi:signal transduction histidine kinase
MNQTSTLTPEVLVPRLGDYLVEKGLITAEQLQKALEYQRLLRDPEQPPPLIGQILIGMKVIDRSSLDATITEQILQLRAALEKNNQELEHRVQERTAELRKALEKLSELSQLKSNFVSNISHELRTPLTHLMGYQELLTNQDLGPLTEDQRNALAIMLRSSHRLGRLIEDLILFSAVESGEVDIHVHLFNLTELAQSMIRRTEEKAQEKLIHLEMTAPEKSLAVKADQEKIAWVIMQLLDNAIKFTPKGGQVTLELKISDNKAQIMITDTGIGIPEDKQVEIFEPFHQLDNSSTRRYGGTGIGLSLAQKIIEAHGSDLYVVSHPGQGSKFGFSLFIDEYLLY